HPCWQSGACRPTGSTRLPRRALLESPASDSFSRLTASDRLPNIVGSAVMPLDRTPGDFGSRLREARERRGVTLRQIANATKVSVSVLDALERNDISRLPGGIFGRAFVRSYAVEVGLDPEVTIQDFMATFPNDSVTVGHPTSERQDEYELFENDRRRAGTYLSLVAISIP